MSTARIIDHPKKPRKNCKGCACGPPKNLVLLANLYSVLEDIEDNCQQFGAIAMPPNASDPRISMRYISKRQEWGRLRNLLLAFTLLSKLICQTMGFVTISLGCGRDQSVVPFRWRDG